MKINIIVVARNFINGFNDNIFIILKKNLNLVIKCST